MEADGRFPCSGARHRLKEPTTSSVDLGKGAAVVSGAAFQTAYTA